MGNRRLGTKRLENVMDNMLSNAALNGLNGSPFTIKNPDRYYLEEYFSHQPALNAALDETDTEAAYVPANKHFEVLGTNATSALVDWGADDAGLLLTTATGDNDQIIILPHLNTLEDSQAQSAWGGVLWGTENQVQWETAIRTPATITTMSFWGGLKLTNTSVYATDANQAYFVWCTDDDLGALTTNANLHFVYSIANTDYITDLGIAVAADTNYRLGITVDSDRKASAWVNGVQYSLTGATTAGGVATGKGTVKSLALTDNIDLIPYVGVQCHANSAARALHLFYEKISRIFFENE